MRYLTRLFRRLCRRQPPPSHQPEFPRLSARSFDEVIGHLADAYPEQRRRILANGDAIRAVVFPHREPDTEGGGRRAPTARPGVASGCCAVDVIRKGLS